MNWPEAILGMVTIVSTLIYLGCTSWYWFGVEGDTTTEEPKPLPGYAPGGYIRPLPTRPTPARKPYW